MLLRMCGKCVFTYSQERMNGSIVMENNTEFPQENRFRTAVRFSNTTPCCINRKMKCQIERFLHSHVYSCISHNN